MRWGNKRSACRIWAAHSIKKPLESKGATAENVGWRGAEPKGDMEIDLLVVGDVRRRGKTSDWCRDVPDARSAQQTHESQARLLYGRMHTFRDQHGADVLAIHGQAPI